MHINKGIRSIEALIWPFIVIFLFIAGCGYEFVKHGSDPKTSLPTLAIEVNDKASTIEKLQWIVYDETKNIFLRNYGHKISPRESADYLVSIDIIKVQKESSGYVTKKVQVKGQDISYPLLGSAYLKILFSVKVVDLKNEKVLWSDTKEEKELYAISEDPNRTSYNMKQAIAKILDRLTSLIYGAGLNQF